MKQQASTKNPSHIATHPDEPITAILEECIHISETLQNKRTRSEYIAATKSYLINYFDELQKRSRYQGIEDDFSLQSEIVDDLQFMVQAGYKEENGSENVSVKFSMGSYLAIQDISLRALCSQNFYNPLSGDSEYRMRWRGSQVKSPPKFFEPEQRYLNYAQTIGAVDNRISDIYEQSGFSTEDLGKLPWAGGILDRVPIDEDRLTLAAHMQHVSMMFMFLHEECHYRQGHLPFLKNDWQNYSSEEQIQISRCFEYQADKDACQGILELFIDKSFQEMLPSYARKDLSWLIRIVLTSLGLCFLLAEIDRRKLGECEYYPRPLTRLFGVFKAIQGMMLIKQTYREFSYGIFGRRLTEAQFLGQCVRAFTGALWDLTEVQMLIADSVNFDEFGFWPLSDAFPFMASSVLVVGEQFSSEGHMLERDMETARLCARDFNMSVEDAMDFRDFAISQVHELRKLIEASDSLRPLTDKYRFWETYSGSLLNTKNRDNL